MLFYDCMRDLAFYSHVENACMTCIAKQNPKKKITLSEQFQNPIRKS